VLGVLNETLRRDYRTRVAIDGRRGHDLALQAPRPDLILLDIEMPGLDGYELCQRLKLDPRTAEIPVIFMSSHSETVDVTFGLDMGAADYVSKPLVTPILLARIRNQLRLAEAMRRVADQNVTLERLVAERTAALHAQTEEVLRTQEATLVALGALAETRDNDTGNHIRRTQGYVQILCEAIRPLAMLRESYSDEELGLMWKTAPLHDIGKVGIPDAILLKPGRLTAHEFEVMKQHTTLGRKALGFSNSDESGQRGFLQIATQIACYHHERWDGSGYPEGLSGSGIPLPARLMALADVYDALVSARVYKPAMPHRDALSIIAAERGRQFDPNLTDCFFEHSDLVASIAQQFAEPEPGLDYGQHLGDAGLAACA
jgi:putative two-component system response regulator